jgi:hypothetical protein
VQIAREYTEKKVGIKWAYINIIKGTYKRPTAKILLNGEN